MALDERINHIPFIQTGAAIIIRNENGQILLQERTDRNKWGLDSETKRLQFFNPDEVPENLMDIDLIEAYLKYNESHTSYEPY